MEARSYPHCGDRLTCTPVQRWKEDTTSHTGERLRRPALFGYALAFVSVGAALLLTIILLHFDSPLPFTAFALSAIAVTFWYGRTKPGILAVFLSTLTRGYFFKPATTAVSRMLYDSPFLVFMLLIIRLLWERDELEVKVAERTEELTGANEKLRIEIVERKQAEEVVKQAEEELRRLSGQLLRSQDEERRRIARDLHDSTGQDLVALATMLGELCASTPSSSPKSRGLVSECQALAEHCIR